MNCKKCDRLQAEVDDLWRYRKRAEKAEQERGEARKFATAEHVRATEAEKERDEVGEMAASLRSQLAEALDRAAQPRPLTPDAITDEAVRLVQERIKRRATYIPAETIRLALEDAFAPARPEGAEKVESQIEAWSMSPDGGVLNATQHRTLADFLAARLNASPKESR